MQSPGLGNCDFPVAVLRPGFLGKSCANLRLLFPALSSDTTVTVWEYVWEWKVGRRIIGPAGGWKEE